MSEDIFLTAVFSVRCIPLTAHQLICPLPLQTGVLPVWYFSDNFARSLDPVKKLLNNLLIWHTM